MSTLAYAESDNDTFHDAVEGFDEDQNDDDTDEYDVTVVASDKTGDSSSRQGSFAGDETDSSSQKSAFPVSKTVSSFL
jgi:hypothetical protein